MELKLITIIAVYDSYLKNLVPMAKFFQKNGINIKFYIADLISERVIKQSNIDFDYNNISVTDLHAGKFNQDSQVVVIGAGGSDLIKIAAKIPSNVFTISLFPGLTSQGIYKGFEDRLCTDLILLNNVLDYMKFKDFAADMKASSLAFMLGFSSLTKINKISDSDIVFFEQNFPDMTYSEKAYILDKLILLAAKNSNRNVVIKLRSILGEATPHNSEYRIEDILKKISKKSQVPKNIVLSFGSVDEVLATAGLVISVSSAAIVEALYNNIKAVILADFGIRANLGNDAFLGSGIYANFENIINNEIPTVNQAWANKYIVAAESNYAEMLEFLTKKVQEKQVSKPCTFVEMRNRNILKEIKLKSSIYGGFALNKEVLHKKYIKFKNSRRVFFEDAVGVFAKKLSKLFK